MSFAFGNLGKLKEVEFNETLEGLVDQHDKPYDGRRVSGKVYFRYEPAGYERPGEKKSWDGVGRKIISEAGRFAADAFEIAFTTFLIELDGNADKNKGQVGVIYYSRLPKEETVEEE